MTKDIVAQAVPWATGTVFARFLLHNIMLIHGSPKESFAHRETNFTAHVPTDFTTPERQALAGLRVPISGRWYCVSVIRTPLLPSRATMHLQIKEIETKS